MVRETEEAGGNDNLTVGSSLEFVHILNREPAASRLKHLLATE